MSSYIAWPDILAGELWLARKRGMNYWTDDEKKIMRATEDLFREEFNMPPLCEDIKMPKTMENSR